uniref:Uncharacterized protein n=1 Tax=Buteo japonicus TaxID=224669 RepID=A0A8B9Z6P4_9AVES
MSTVASLDGRNVKAQARFREFAKIYEDRGNSRPLFQFCLQLTEEDKVEDDVVFYLVFTGSTVQHCTSTRKINPGSLETISPGHDCCETVKVALCASREGHPVLVVAEESFQFVQDEAYDAAQFLATCAGNQQALNFTRFLDRSRPPAADVDFLDEKVALAFRHLKLPAEWNVLGADQSLTAWEKWFPALGILHTPFKRCVGLRARRWDVMCTSMLLLHIHPILCTSATLKYVRHGCFLCVFSYEIAQSVVNGQYFNIYPERFFFFYVCMQW